MASINPPVCTYQPLLPKKLVSEGILSDIQLESVIRAGADIPPKEWGDLKIDISPKSYILDYLNKSFPIHLMEEIEVEGNLITTFALDKEGNKIVIKKLYKFAKLLF